MNYIRSIQALLLLVASALLGACSSADDWQEDKGTEKMQGGLQLSLTNISTTVSETRSAPAALQVPQATDFHLNIIRQSNGAVIYDDAFTAERIAAAPDDYTITATCGSNPVIGVDAPYYVGNATATVVSTTESTAVSLPVTVGNALVTVLFGSNEDEAARFSRFYDTYAVNVAVGNNTASITNAAPAKSVYVRAGTTVALTFSGYLKALGQEVTMPIVLPDGVSYTLEAAQQLIITLIPGESEESAVVNVQKAEITPVSLEEKINYNWLPRPAVTTEHKYSNGNLVGTDLSIAASFPDVNWEASIHQGTSSGTIVRTLSGTGALTSSYKDNSDWPFLPAGTYTATYRYTSKQGVTYNFDKTTTFTVPEPNLTLTGDAYTSYSLYEQGDISGANACEPLTVYAPQVTWNVADALLANGNYTKTYTTSIADITATVEAKKSKATLANITEVPVSGDPYQLTFTADFCGQQVSATTPLRITGLPITFAPPTAANWTLSGNGSWESTYVVLGKMGTSNSTLTNTTSVRIPARTYICMDYDIMIHPATMGTTFSVACSGNTIFSQEQKGGAANSNDYTFQGSTPSYIFTSAITELQCKNSYGAGQTCSNIYSLTFKYAAAE